MVGKTYLRYVDGPQGGAVASRASLSLDCIVGHATYTTTMAAAASTAAAAPPATPSRPRGRTARGQPQPQQALSMLFVPSLEAVRVYAARSGDVLHTLVPAEAKLPLEVTALHVATLGGSGSTTTTTTTTTIAAHEQGWLMLVGYNNGSVAAFACGPTNNYGKPLCRFYAMGHRVDTKVLALAVGARHVRGCSAGQDTDVTVWDLVTHEAAFRLRGHRGGVVAVAFVGAHNDNNNGGATSMSSGREGGEGGGDADDELLVSAAADGLVKVWDLALRQCVHTIVASDTQVTAMVLDAAGRRLYCGMRESFLRVYNTEQLRPRRAHNVVVDASNVVDGNDDTATTALLSSGGLVEHGVLPRKFHKPVTVLRFSHDGAFLLACTSKTVEVYGVLTADEVRKKLQRKRKRRRTHVDERQQQHNSNNNSDEHDAHDGEAAVRATAAEEVVLLRTFFFTDKVRSAVFVPLTTASSTRTHGGGSGEAAHATTTLQLAVTFSNNNVHVYTTSLTTSDATGTATRTLSDLRLRHSYDYKGHHSDVRRLCFVDADATLLSLSAERVMRWTLRIHADRVDCDHVGDSDFYDAREAALARVDFKGALLCTGGVDVHEATCMAALTSSLCCVGQHDGALLLLDVASSRELARVSAAHVGEVKDVVLRGGGGGGGGGGGSSDTTAAASAGGRDDAAFVSVGADRRMVLWTIGVVEASANAQDDDNNDDDNDDDDNDDNRRASSGHTSRRTRNKRTPHDDATAAVATTTTTTPLLLATHEVELTELPLFVRVSGDRRFVGVGLHNHTVQLFFGDTLKPYLSLFGHKLPPTAMDFSTDGALVATVGLDKSLRFWGTDFGDCHRAIHAHDDAVTHVVFQPHTHYAFTVGLDAALKMWDGDNWTMVQQFRHHPRALWAVAVTHNGTLLVSAGADACLRCLVRTQDIVFPHEEEERAAQQAMDEEAARRAALAQMDRLTTGESSAVAATAATTRSGGGGGGGSAAEVAVAGQPTVRTAEAAEQLMEALDLVSVEQQRRQNPHDTTTQRHPLLRQCTEYEYLWSVLDAIRPSELRHALAALTSVHVDALLDGLAAMLRQRVVQNYETAAKVLLALLMPTGGGPAIMATALRTTALRGELSEAHAARRLAALRRDIAAGLDAHASQMDYNIAGLQMVRTYLQDTEHIRFFDLSAIQGHKKRYHTRALVAPSAATTTTTRKH